MEIFLIGLVVLGPFVFLFFYQKSQSHKTTLLRAHFKSSNAELLPFEGVPWRLVRIGARRGSFPQLWCYLQRRSAKVCIGHEKSRGYAPFWVTKKRSQIVNGLCIAAMDERIKAELVTLAQGPLSSQLKSVFDREFCHLSVGDEWHIDKWSLTQRTVLRFTCLKEEVYLSPQKLEETMRVLAQTFRALGFESERV